MVYSRGFSLAALGAVLGCVAVAGCGNTVSGPPTVNMSLVAPTDGATVSVRTITVTGRVSPSDARVLVAGQHAAVRGGTFHLRLRLPLKVNHIGILGTASGYRPQSLTATVRVSRSAPPGSIRRSSAGRSLPSYFAIRAEAICSTANQRATELPKPPLANVATVGPELLQIVAEKDRQLFALSAPFMKLPDVRRFIADMRAEAAEAQALVGYLLRGDPQAAAQQARRDFVRAPTYWQDAGRLGVPDCGAVAVPVGG